jgi:hypothetical protein
MPDSAEFAERDQTEFAERDQTEFAERDQTEFAERDQTEFAERDQTSLQNVTKLTIYVKDLKDNTKNILSIPPQSLLNAKAGKNEENSLGGVASTAGFVVFRNFELTAVDLEIKETALGGDEESFNFENVDWDKIQNELQEWEVQQNIEIKEEVIDCATTPVTKIENSYVDHNICLEGQSSAVAAQPVQNRVQATLTVENAAKYIRVNEPGVKRNLDGSEQFPWDIEGDRYHFHAGFEDWMCQRLSATKFYKSLTVGSALTQIRKHISIAKYNNQRRDELFIEWNAMIESNPALVSATSRDALPKEVATMKVADALNQQADKVMFSELERSDIFRAYKKQFFIDNNLKHLPMTQVFDRRPNWVEELRDLIISDRPEFAEYRHEIKAFV